MLAVSPDMDELTKWGADNGVTEELNEDQTDGWLNLHFYYRPSQKKFRGGRELKFEIVKYSSPTPVCLNKPFINILDQVHTGLFATSCDKQIPGLRAAVAPSASANMPPDSLADGPVPAQPHPIADGRAEGAQSPRGFPEADPLRDVDGHQPDHGAVLPVTAKDVRQSDAQYARRHFTPPSVML